MLSDFSDIEDNNLKRAVYPSPGKLLNRDKYGRADFEDKIKTVPKEVFEKF